MLVLSSGAGGVNLGRNCLEQGFLWAHRLAVGADQCVRPSELCKGKWVQEQDIWQFEEGDKGKSYSLTIIQKEEKEKKTSKLIGHLVKIDGDLFLDMYPDEMEMGVGDWYKFHLLGVHTFMKVDRIEPTPVMRAMDPEKIAKMLKEKPDTIKHEIVEDRVVLTASPKELQAFLKAHADDGSVFGDSEEFGRYVAAEADGSCTGGDESEDKKQQD